MAWTDRRTDGGDRNIHQSILFKKNDVHTKKTDSLICLFAVCM